MIGLPPALRSIPTFIASEAVAACTIRHDYHSRGRRVRTLRRMRHFGAWAHVARTMLWKTLERGGWPMEALFSSLACRHHFENEGG